MPSLYSNFPDYLKCIILQSDCSNTDLIDVHMIYLGVLSPKSILLSNSPLVFVGFPPKQTS